MIKKYKSLVIVTLIALVALAVNVANNHINYVRNLEQFRGRQFEFWIRNQMVAATTLDRALAEALVASDAEGLKKALSNAHEQAYASREAIWGGYASPSDVSREIDKWGYHYAYAKAGEYLFYLAQREPTATLNETEVHNLVLTRTYTDTFYQAFEQMLELIQYQATLRGGYSTTRFYPWSKIEKSQATVAVLSAAGHKLNGLAEIGSDDVHFLSYKEQRWANATKGYIPEGLAYSDEQEYNDSQQLARAKEFMRTFVSGEVTSALFIPDTQTGTAKAWSTGGGSGSDVGSYTQFGLKDTLTGWNYHIGVTEIGGHINQIELRDRPATVGTSEKVRAVAEALVAKWAEFEGVTLELHQSTEAESYANYVYAAVVDGVM